MTEIEIKIKGETIIVTEINEETWIIGIIGHREMIVETIVDVQVTPLVNKF